LFEQKLYAKAIIAAYHIRFVGPMKSPWHWCLLVSYFSKIAHQPIVLVIHHVHQIYRTEWMAAWFAGH